MRRFIIAVFLAALMIAYISGSSLAETIKGKISKDTTIGGEIVIKGDVRVEKGVTLTIEKGARVKFDRGSLEVYGTVIAKGAPKSNIRFVGVKKGRNQRGGIRIINSKEKKSVISHCDFNGLNTAVTIINSSAVIEDSTFLNNQIAVDAKQKDETIVKRSVIKNSKKVGIFCKNDSQASIIDNKISGIRKFGVYVYRSGGVNVSGNKITDCGSGIMIGFVGSDSHVTGNDISSNKTGIIVEKGANPLISQNTITKNDIGIKISRRSDPKVKDNDITDNKKGIFVTYSSYPVIGGNNIYDNEYAVYLEFQSSQWEKSQGGSVKRGGEKKRIVQARGAFGGASSAKFVKPRENLSDKVDSRGNFWGGEVVKEMEMKGAASNIPVIHDYYDAKEFVEDGKRYKLDSVDYSEWSNEKIKHNAKLHSK